jgi:hypothetical protein
MFYVFWVSSITAYLFNVRVCPLSNLAVWLFLH